MRFGLRCEQQIDHLLRDRCVDITGCENDVDVHLGQDRRSDVRACGQRLEESLFVGTVMPGSAFSEDLRVKIPRAKLLLFPYEFIADAEPAAGRALHDR